MDFQWGLIIVGFLMGSVILFLYKIAKKSSNRLLKYIPAAASLVGVVFFMIKLNFISQGYDGIVDMLAIILLSITFGISLLIAIIMELIGRRTKLQS